MTQALARTTPQRTILEINVEHLNNVWPVVDAWAPGAGFNLLLEQGTHRLYQKGTGFLVAPMMLDLELQNGRLVLQSWVRSNLFVRIMALFMLPAEMNIQPGGFRAVLPRNIARGKVNELLTKLGAPPIQ
jgi:hypothetical protein